MGAVRALPNWKFGIELHVYVALNGKNKLDIHQTNKAPFMSNPKYQLFISSTFKDLTEERQAVSRAILNLGHIPAGIEFFPASDTEQLTYIKKNHR